MAGMASGGEGAATRASPPRPPRNDPTRVMAANGRQNACPGTLWGEGGITAQQAEGMTSEAHGRNEETRSRKHAGAAAAASAVRGTVAAAALAPVRACEGNAASTPQL